MPKGLYLALRVNIVHSFQTYLNMVCAAVSELTKWNTALWLYSLGGGQIVFSCDEATDNGDAYQFCNYNRYVLKLILAKLRV